MKITLLEINDYKRLRNVIIEPGERNLILIGGKNTQGKSSLLGAMGAALGGKKEVAKEPIRQGADKASIRVEFDDGALVVRRKFTAKSTSIEVTSDGGVIKSPQKMLDKLVGARFIDPMQFSRLPAKEQREVMLGCVELGIDLDENIAKEKAVYTERRDLNRDIKKLEARCATAPEKPADDSTDPAALQEQVNVLQGLRSASMDAEREMEALNFHIERLRKAKASQQEKLREVREALRQSTLDLEEAIVDASPKFDQLRLGIDANPSDEELQETQQKISDFLKNGDASSNYQAWELNCKELTELKKTSQKCTLDITTIKDERTAALAAAEMPIPGLTFGEDGLQLNGVPFEDASGAESLRASIAISWALKPDLQDIWVEDGALLDEDSLALVEKFATENDLRIWLERVGENDEEAIIMVDGQVKS